VRLRGGRPELCRADLRRAGSHLCRPRSHLRRAGPDLCGGPHLRGRPELRWPQALRQSLRQAELQQVLPALPAGSAVRLPQVLQAVQ
jgi:hypothetical protein